MEIPKEFNDTIYFYWDTEMAFLYIDDTDKLPDHYVLLGKLENVSVTFDNQQAVNESVKQIRKAIDDVRVEAERKVNELENTIIFY